MMDLSLSTTTFLAGTTLTLQTTATRAKRFLE